MPLRQHIAAVAASACMAASVAQAQDAPEAMLVKRTLYFQDEPARTLGHHGSMRACLDEARLLMDGLAKNAVKRPMRVTCKDPLTGQSRTLVNPPLPLTPV